MALAPIIDYATLQAAVAGWVERTDVGDVVPICIGVAHSRLNRTLRVADMCRRSTASLLAAAEFVDLPDDFIEAIRIRANTTPSSVPLAYLTPAQFQGKLYENIQTSQVPAYYSKFGNQLMVAPQPTGDFELEIMYYGRIDALSTAAPTNWLITKWPEAYLYGTLVAMEPYLRDDGRMQMWKDQFEQTINEIQGADDRAQSAGGRMTKMTRPIA